MKKIVYIMISTLFIWVATSGLVFGDTDLSVRINQNAMLFPDAQPFINADGRTMVPVRFVTENMGFKVVWDAAARTVDISKDHISILLKIDDYITYKTEQLSWKELKSWEEMDTNAVIKDGRTFVPLRFVSEIMGYKVAWNGTTKTVQINSEYQSEGYTVPYSSAIAVKTYSTDATENPHNVELFISFTKKYDAGLQKRLSKQILESKYSSQNEKLEEIILFLDKYTNDTGVDAENYFTLKGQEVIVSIGHDAVNIIVYKEK